MDELMVFLQTYGWQLALIALAGVILLGILKYCKVFEKFDEKVRHALYLIVSVGISIVGAVIYLACVHQLDIVYIATMAGAIFALNQAFYTIYDTTTLKALLKKLWDKIVELIKSGKAQDVVEGIKEQIESKDEPKQDTDTSTEPSEEKKE